MAGTRVREVCIEAEWAETYYQVVRLGGGCHAFTWNDTGYLAGDLLPDREIDAPTAAHGAAIYATVQEAERAFRRCAEAIGQTDPEGERQLLEGPDENTL